jgi:type II secretory pathway component HofQ
MLIDLRPRAKIEPAANVNADWDKIEAKLVAEAQTPVPGQILVDSPKAELSAPANTVTVFKRDSSYAMLLGGKAVSEAARQEALPFLSNLPLMGHMFSNGSVTRKDGELLVMVQPSIIERSWD